MGPEMMIAPGVIHADASYTLDEFKRRTQLSDSSIRKAKDRGLVVRGSGKYRFILGADWHRYLESQSQGEQQS